ncbi:unnamed protein product [Rotaria sp. Silwood2]|nr:unnamed protein product [Rotaria sp. Silwood2]
MISVSISEGRTSPTKQRLINSSTQNLETEYIKQLQEQIYYLETECLYLRDQLNKNSIVLDRSLKTDRVYQVEQERSDLQRSLIQTSSQFDQLASEKHGLTIALDELRRKFDIEKQNLLDELDMLRRARETFEQEKMLRDQELRQIRDRSRASSDELKNSQTKIRLLEQQLDQQINQNKDLTDELHHFKIESNNLQRSLNDYQLTSRERDRLQDHVAELEKELNNLRQELKAHDTRYNEAQFLRNKLADEKGALMKEVSRLENLTKEFERDLEQLRHTLRELPTYSKPLSSALLREQPHPPLSQQYKMKRIHEWLKKVVSTEYIEYNEYASNESTRGTYFNDKLDGEYDLLSDEKQLNNTERTHDEAHRVLPLFNSEIHRQLQQRNLLLTRIELDLYVI